MKNIIISLLIVMGCDNINKSVEQQEHESKNIEYAANQSILTQDATYHKDTRTDLCFVMYRHWYVDGVVQNISNVPCTEKVESLIK